MTKILAIVRRELIAYFSSPLAYIVLTAFLAIQGWVFVNIVSILSGPGLPVMTPMVVFFTSAFFWFVLLVMVPLITMRLIAEERRSGTIEVLLTSPVTEGQVIAGKFLAALFFYLVLWLPTVLYTVILKQHSEIDVMPVVSSYLGVLTIGFLFIAVGTFASTLSHNQLIAGVITFAVLLILFSLGLAEQVLLSSSIFKDVIGHMNLWTHMDDYAKGIVDTRHIVYELSVGLLFLFLATKSLEVKKWR